MSHIIRAQYWILVFGIHLTFKLWHLKFKNILILCFHYFAFRAIASAMAGVFVMVFSFSLLTVHHSLFTDH
jgi:hypothetical protein